MGRALPALLLALAACGERPGPEIRSSDVTGPAEEPSSEPSCVVPEPPGRADPGAPETWVVSSGDTLATIARRCYGNEALWKEIAAANRDVIGPRDTIRPGTVLRIPRDSR